MEFAGEYLAPMPSMVLNSKAHWQISIVQSQSCSSMVNAFFPEREIPTGPANICHGHFFTDPMPPAGSKQIWSRYGMQKTPLLVAIFDNFKDEGRDCGNRPSI